MSDHPANISPYDIYAIYRDSHGNMWFGTGAIGACRFDGTNFDWIHEEDVTELHNGPSNGIRSIAEDKDGYSCEKRVLFAGQYALLRAFIPNRIPIKDFHIETGFIPAS